VKRRKLGVIVLEKREVKKKKILEDCENLTKWKFLGNCSG
jgi:hypothetical protein